MRLDKYLVEKMGVRSRSLAGELIRVGAVSVTAPNQQKIVAKASLVVSDQHQIKLGEHPLLTSVSRGYLKLRPILSQFNLDELSGVVLDVGQSTGGFTQAVLDCGASRVIGVDVGSNQLAKELREDHRVVCHENTDARELGVEWLKIHAGVDEVDLVVMDLSFISIKLVLPQLAAITSKIVSLVKPQFELSPIEIGKKGLVRDPRNYQKVESAIRELAQKNRMRTIGYTESPIDGRDGNREFFIALECH